jgi:DNA repair protein RecO (recombination protein O)
MALAATAVEAVALGVEEGEAFPDLFRLLAGGLEVLEAAPHPGVVLQGFILHLLRLLGYLPELHVCVRCRTGVSPYSDASLSPAGGGILCDACRRGAPDAVPASAAALGFLRGARGSTLRVIDRLSLPPQVLQEVSWTLRAFLSHILGRPLRSSDFLARL